MLQMGQACRAIHSSAGMQQAEPSACTATDACSMLQDSRHEPHSRASSVAQPAGPRADSRSRGS